MAITLKDLKKKSPSVAAAQESKNKKSSARPWESFEKLGNQTRTVKAHEAVRKAQKIIEKNNVAFTKTKGKVLAFPAASKQNRNEEEEKIFDLVDTSYRAGGFLCFIKRLIFT